MANPERECPAGKSADGSADLREGAGDLPPEQMNMDELVESTGLSVMPPESESTSTSNCFTTEKENTRRMVVSVLSNTKGVLSITLLWQHKKTVH